MPNIGITIAATVTAALVSILAYLPKFLGGLVILLVGVVIASLLRSLVEKLFKYVQIEKLFESIGLGKAADIRPWPSILAEVVRWTVIVLFLIPAVEAWGLPKVTEVLNEVILYIPNVIVAAVVGYVGLAVAGLIHDVVKNAARSMGSSSANFLANVAKVALIFFTTLVVLNQLGVAADLVRILFTGIVAMVALAGGLSFGLGGQEAAKKLFDRFLKGFGD